MAGQKEKGKRITRKKKDTSIKKGGKKGKATEVSDLPSFEKARTKAAAEKKAKKKKCGLLGSVGARFS